MFKHGCVVSSVVRGIGLSVVTAVACIAVSSWVLLGLRQVAAASPGAGVVAAITTPAAGVPKFSSPLWLTVGFNPQRVVSADLNGDGEADLATVDWGSADVAVLFGLGTGGFRHAVRYRARRHAVGLAVTDVDSDGDADLIAASGDRSGSISVFANRGAGRFRRARVYASGANAYAVAVADLNADGKVDVVTAHESRHNLTVLSGTGG